MLSSDDPIAQLPFLGSGLGYRRELRKDIVALRHAIDLVEILVDQFLDEEQSVDELREICSLFPAIPHGIGLSVGSAGGLNFEYLKAAKRISDITNSRFYSEHLCMTRAPGIDIGHLSPLWFTEEILRTTIRNVTQAQEYLEKPLILENVTYLFDVPNASMTQAEFFHRLVEATRCGILLDVTNVYINSVNHQFDPVAFLDAMPLERIVQIHLAGGFWSHGVFVDGHSELVQEESWRLLEVLTKKTKVRASILEHDANFPESIDPLLLQVKRAREMIDF